MDKVTAQALVDRTHDHTHNTYVLVQTEDGWFLGRRRFDEDGRLYIELQREEV